MTSPYRRIGIAVLSQVSVKAGEVQSWRDLVGSNGLAGLSETRRDYRAAARIAASMPMVTRARWLNWTFEGMSLERW
jgi:hypothetical protein